MKCRIPIVIVKIFIIIIYYIIIILLCRKTQRAAQTVRPRNLKLANG